MSRAALSTRTGGSCQTRGTSLKSGGDKYANLVNVTRNRFVEYYPTNMLVMKEDAVYAQFSCFVRNLELKVLATEADKKAHDEMLARHEQCWMRLRVWRKAVVGITFVYVIAQLGGGATLEYNELFRLTVDKWNRYGVESISVP